MPCSLANPHAFTIFVYPLFSRCAPSRYSLYETSCPVIQVWLRIANFSGMSWPMNSSRARVVECMRRMLECSVNAAGLEIERRLRECCRLEAERRQAGCFYCKHEMRCKADFLRMREASNMQPRTSAHISLVASHVGQGTIRMPWLDDTQAERFCGGTLSIALDLNRLIDYLSILAREEMGFNRSKYGSRYMSKIRDAKYWFRTETAPLCHKLSAKACSIEWVVAHNLVLNGGFERDYNVFMTVRFIDPYEKW